MKANVMRSTLPVLCLLLCLTIPIHAQDEPTPYDIALQRIREAAASGVTELRLSGLGLTELPPEIGQLISLQGLSLEDNELTGLPSEIGRLNNLHRLNLQLNHLTALLPEIGQLHNLQLLLLASNQLTTLPPEIGQLSNLQELYLNDNQLTNLPAEIGQLNNLQALFLGGNQLTILPPEIGQLHNMMWLSLHHNQLAFLPAEVNLLSRLCVLDLQANNLRNLPIILGNMNLLEQEECPSDFPGIYLDNNPLVSPPPEVVEQGTAAVLAYLRNQAWYHLQRLIIAGASGVGLLAILVLGVRWKQRGGRKPKQKREAES